MIWVARVLVGLVALLHLWFCVLETFLWRRPLGRRTFGNSEQRAADTAILAANQGLYNVFLAAGLIWSLFAADGARLQTFFLGCVVAAGLFGGLTASRAIIFVQALPAALALAAVWLAR